MCIRDRTLRTSDISRFLNQRDVGTIGINYIYGLTDNLDFSAGIDIPIGFKAKLKYQFETESLRNIHAVSLETQFPFLYTLNLNLENRLIASAVPSYIYTYRFDDLFNLSLNGFVTSSFTTTDFILLPGIAGGIGIGDEVRFTAGANYSRSVFSTDGSQFQFLTIESSIKVDF